MCGRRPSHSCSVWRQCEPCQASQCSLCNALEVAAAPQPLPAPMKGGILRQSVCRRQLAPTKHTKYQTYQHSCRMEWTDLHFRQLVRMLSRHTWLYTEMVVDKTLLHNPLTDK